MTPLILLAVIVPLFIVLFLFYIFFQQRIQQLQTHIQLQNKDLTEKIKTTEEMQQQLHGLQTKLRQTFEDSVTHLLSWEMFEDRLRQQIIESQRYHLTLGVMFVDIDDFKMINDVLSYEIGNTILQEVAGRLKACIRQVDSVTRFSKDTFVILLSQLNKPEMASIVAQRILQSLKDPFVIESQDQELYLTVGIGIAIYPTDGMDASELLRSADHALHLAKSKGKHLYQFYQQDMHKRSQRELTINTNLSRETIFDEFIIYYQPIINAKTNAVFCMEALLHWKHPQLGLINSDELFNYAEKQRKTNLIAEWLITKACKQFLQWRASELAPTYLSLPLLISQLANSQFIYNISQILKNIGFDPQWLMLEMEESTTEVAFDVLQKSFNMLKYIGVQVAIDDFGSDTFALRYLKNININYLKLDPALISDIESNKQTVAVVKSVLYLGKSLSIDIIAKGVQSKAQVHLLKDLGCYLMQGDFIGKPLSEAEVKDKMIEPVSS